MVVEEREGGAGAGGKTDLNTLVFCEMIGVGLAGEGVAERWGVYHSEVFVECDEPLVKGAVVERIEAKAVLGNRPFLARLALRPWLDVRRDEQARVINARNAAGVVVGRDDRLPEEGLVDTIMLQTHSVQSRRRLDLLVVLKRQMPLETSYELTVDLSKFLAPSRVLVPNHFFHLRAVLQSGDTSPRQCWVQPADVPHLHGKGRRLTSHQPRDTHDLRRGLIDLPERNLKIESKCNDRLIMRPFASILSHWSYSFLHLLGYP